MKKFKKLVFVLLFASFLFFAGCNDTYENRIFNKSYSIDIDVIKLENTLNATIEKVSPAIFGVSCYKRDILSSLKERRTAIGSGFVYKAEALMKDGSVEKNIKNVKDSADVSIFNYYLVTNYHVINGARSITVYDGYEDKEIEASVIGKDANNDLAVVNFKYSKYIEPLTFASSDDIKAGDFVLAVGNPGGYDYFSTATFGIVSSVNRHMLNDVDDDGYGDFDTYLLQHDAAINHGNSGGPLINIYGKVVGVNVMKDSENDGVGFAIPIDTVNRVIDKIADGTSLEYITLGVTGFEIKSLIDTDREKYEIPSAISLGFYVEKVNDGVGKDAGLMEKDIILAIDDCDIRYSYVLKAELNKHFKGSGDTSNLLVYREGQYITLTITY